MKKFEKSLLETFEQYSAAYRYCVQDLVIDRMNMSVLRFPDAYESAV